MLVIQIKGGEFFLKWKVFVLFQVFSSGVYIVEVEYLGQRYAERMMIK